MNKLLKHVLGKKFDPMELQALMYKIGAVYRGGYTWDMQGTLFFVKCCNANAGKLRVLYVKGGELYENRTNQM